MSVVIPTFNEAANLPHVLPRIPKWIDELIVVDGHSIDDTVDIALSLWPSARVILQEGRGKGNAVACGFAAVCGDIVVMLDADGSTDPEEIPQFLAPLLDGADFVKGSRALEGGGSSDISAFRDLGNRVLTGIANRIYKTRYTDLCYGYNAFWAYCLPHIAIDSDGFEVEMMIHARIARAGFTVCEVPSMEHERINGKSNLRTIRDGWRVLRTMIAERPVKRARRELRTDVPSFTELAVSFAPESQLSNE